VARARLPLVVAVAIALGPAACHRHRGTFRLADRLAAEAGKRLAPVDAAGRRDELRHALIFETVDVHTRSLWVGPDEGEGFAFDARVSCDFVEPRPERVPTGGTTPKFFCTLRHGRGHADVKVKYGRNNPETYGEVLASRLFWALGLAADRNYPVRLRCHHCPAEPWLAYRNFPKPDLSPRDEREFDDAVIQRLYPGVPIETRADEGWTFAELATVRESAGGAARAEIDALVLLAAFVAHADDKPENHRLTCPFSAIGADGSCRAPRLMIADLGSTFGRGAGLFGLIDRAARPSFAGWSTLPMWHDPAACRAHWIARRAASHPTVSEAGRKLLADRLAALDDRQIRDLFKVARIETMGETRGDGHGGTRAVTVEDWLDAFKRRRAALVDHHCPQ
jgi:hypothetical protein